MTFQDQLMSLVVSPIPTHPTPGPQGPSANHQILLSPALDSELSLPEPQI